MKKADKYLGITNAAARLNVTEETIRQRLKTGNVYGHEVIDGHHYFDIDLLTREIWGIRRYKVKNG